MANDKIKQIDLQPELASRIEDRLEYSDFETIEEYVNFSMSQILFQVEKQEKDGDKVKTDNAIKDRLQSLGYIDE